MAQPADRPRSYECTAFIASSARFDRARAPSSGNTRLPLHTTLSAGGVIVPGASARRIVNACEASVCGVQHVPFSHLPRQESRADPGHELSTARTESTRLGLLRPPTNRCGVGSEQGSFRTGAGPTMAFSTACAVGPRRRVSVSKHAMMRARTSRMQPGWQSKRSLLAETSPEPPSSEDDVRATTATRGNESRVPRRERRQPVGERGTERATSADRPSRRGLLESPLDDVRSWERTRAGHRCPEAEAPGAEATDAREHPRAWSAPRRVEPGRGGCGVRSARARIQV